MQTPGMTNTSSVYYYTARGTPCPSTPFTKRDFSHPPSIVSPSPTTFHPEELANIQGGFRLMPSHEDFPILSNLASKVKKARKEARNLARGVSIPFCRPQAEYLLTPYEVTCAVEELIKKQNEFKCTRKVFRREFPNLDEMMKEYLDVLKDEFKELYEFIQHQQTRRQQEEEAARAAERERRCSETILLQVPSTIVIAAAKSAEADTTRPLDIDEYDEEGILLQEFASYWLQGEQEEQQQADEEDHNLVQNFASYWLEGDKGQQQEEDMLIQDATATRHNQLAYDGNNKKRAHSAISKQEACNEPLDEEPLVELGPAELDHRDESSVDGLLVGDGGKLAFADDNDDDENGGDTWMDALKSVDADDMNMYLV